MGDRQRREQHEAIVMSRVAAGVGFLTDRVEQLVDRLANGDLDRDIALMRAATAELLELAMAHYAAYHSKDEAMAFLHPFTANRVPSASTN